MINKVKKHSRRLVVGASGVAIAVGSVAPVFAAEVDTNVASIMAYLPQFVTLSIVGAFLYKVKRT